MFSNTSSDKFSPSNEANAAAEKATPQKTSETAPDTAQEQVANNSLTRTCGSDFNSFEEDLNNSTAQLQQIDEEVRNKRSELTTLQGKYDQAQQELEAIEEKTNQAARLMAAEEQKLNSLNNELQLIKQHLDYYGNHLAEKKQEVLAKERTLRQAQIELSATQEDIKQDEQALEEAQNRRQNISESIDAQKTSLNETCQAWQEIYNLWQEKKTAYIAQKAAIQQTNAQINELLKQKPEPMGPSSENNTATVIKPQDIPVTNTPVASLEEITGQPVKKRPGVWGYVVCVLIAIALALAMRAFVFQITLIIGESMMPTLHSGDRVITSRISYILNEPKTGDIAIFRAPDHTDEVYYVKRIIATEGDTIKISNGKVYINGQELAEDYLGDVATTGDIDTIVPADHVFVMGDNRSNSLDSRYPSISFIADDTIIGKAVIRILPLADFGAIN